MRVRWPSQRLPPWPRSRSARAARRTSPTLPPGAAAPIDGGRQGRSSGRSWSSPDRFGAGLVNFTIANFSDSPVRFTLSGPKEAATQPIPPGAPGSLKIELPEGSYEVTAGEAASARPATVKVGPKRPGSENELLLP